MINESIEYFMPVNIQFGTNKIEEAGALVARLGKKALLVTGKRAMKKRITERCVVFFIYALRSDPIFKSRL